jgi:transposase-like protein
MDTHKNAPLTPKGREAMVRSVVEGGLSKAAAARQFNVTAKTVAKWFGRFRQMNLEISPGQVVWSRVMLVQLILGSIGVEHADHSETDPTRTALASLLAGDL